jgi:hypothetical protein
MREASFRRARLCQFVDQLEDARLPAGGWAACADAAKNIPDGRQVPVVDVEQAIRQACRRWRVLEIAADPFRWARSLQLLEGEGLPVMEYPQPPGG